jgi:very-short-patch-repair endonuclease
MTRKLTQEQIINKSIETHGNKYNYSKTIYKNAITKVIIICNKHGEFMQLAYSHISGAGCKKCSIEYISNLHRLSPDKFINKANKIHNNKYDYSKVEYINSQTKIIIICKEHGEFIQKPNEHLRGCGCTKCGKISMINKQSKTQEQFIKEANNIHKNQYDYSKAVYKNSHTKVIIICLIHGEFQQDAQSHLSGTGCMDCFGNRKNTIEQFIKESNIIHINKYDYSKVNYINCDTNIIIICPIHGEFEQTPYSHKNNKHGCVKCGKLLMMEKQKRPLDEFIIYANKIHNNKYDYSKVNYINCDTNIIIICPTHGEFEQRPYVHTNLEHGCSACTGMKRKTNEQFILDSVNKHGNKYDYSLVNYINGKTKVCIICKEHGEFYQIPNSHVRESGCPFCSKNILKTTDDFIKDALLVHDDLYDYSKVNYINSKTNVIIICYKHGEFEQNPNNHLQGKGCSFCHNKTEGIIYNRLFNKYNIIHQFRVDWCKNKRCLPYDFILPEYNIIIECDGGQHFKQVMNWKSPEEQQLLDKYKIKCANDNGHSVIRLLQEDVFKNTYDWVKELDINIQKIINDKIIQNIYMCKNNEYDVYNIEDN